MRSSIVIATYNGGEYILDQLESIRNQTLSPDEVIIIDDASGDDTVRIINNYIDNNSLSSWRMIVNSENIGWKKNFIKGFRLAKGDVIFPCDQDDIWHNDKIGSMLDIMNDRPEVAVLAGEAHKFHDMTKTEGVSGYLDILDADRISGSGKVYVPAFDTGFFRRKPGCVLAIRRDFFTQYDSELLENFAHDAIIPYFAKILGRYSVYDKYVVEWRRHDDSSSKSSSMSRLKRVKELEYDRDMCGILTDFVHNNTSDNSKIKYVNRISEWNYHRIRLVRDRNFISAVLLVKYLNCYTRKRRYLTDLYYAIRKYES